MPYLSIKPITNSKPILNLNYKTAERLGLKHRKIVRISYGRRQDVALVHIVDHVSKNTIELEHRIIEYLKIDISPHYDTRFDQDRLVIGPVIGVLFEYKDASLLRRLNHKAERYFPYIKTMEKMGGLLFFFAKEQIDFEKAEIKGYVYHLSTSTWESSTLPFPGAVFQRATISTEMKRKMDGAILNAHKLSKLECWNMAKEHRILKEYLPETTSEIHIKALEKLASQFGGVFLKHTKKALGEGIYLISKIGNGFSVQKNFAKNAIYMSKQQTAIFLQKHKKDHILQQAIQLKSYENRKIDYRVIVVKDLNESWKCSGIIGWLGEINGLTIQTEVEVNGKKAEEMLKLQFNYSAEEISMKKKELIKIAMMLAAELDRQAGPFNDFGIDIGLDNNGKAWVFEANVGQDLKNPLWLNDFNMYEKIIADILKYAKKVAMK